MPKFGSFFSGSGAKMEANPSIAFKQTVRMMEEGFLKLRADAIRRHLAYETARGMLTDVQAKIPNTSNYKSYRDSLRLVQAGAPSDPVFAVYGNATEKRVVEAKTDVVFFKLKKRNGKFDPVAAVLAEHQPWTMETLPFTPDAKTATLITRRVTRDEVKTVTSAREKERPVWSKKLMQLGVQPKPKKADVPEETTGVADVTYTALRLEFGLGKTKAVAHWRPAVRSARERVLALFQSKTTADVLLNWKNNSWRKWSHQGADIVSSSKIESMIGFQDKVRGTL